MSTDCGFILLAGGESRRMGRSKAWLEFGGRPLLSILAERLLSRFPEGVIVAGPGQELPETPVPVLRDEHPGEGPVAGLAVGLRAVPHPLAFVVSCDVPFLNLDVAEYLANVAACYDLAVPEWEGRRHPLQAVYRTSVQPVLAQQLSGGRRRLMEVLDLVRTVVVPESELRALDPEGRSFFNMNTPEDYRRALSLWEG
jgi:molybdopterin-guanine dinucleotide biosynthesis protein A